MYTTCMHRCTCNKQQDTNVLTELDLGHTLIVITTRYVIPETDISGTEVSLSVGCTRARLRTGSGVALLPLITAGAIVE
jgi:hypothetical protein